MAHVFFDPHRKSRERTLANLPDGRMFLTLRIYLNRTRSGPGDHIPWGAQTRGEFSSGLRRFRSMR